MARAAITECEQCGVAVLNPDVHAQWHQCWVVPTASAMSPASTYSPPSWWREMAAAHGQAEAEPRSPTSVATEHRPSATVRASVFPKEAVLPEDYTPEQVAREAWLSITEWVKDGYQPLLTVQMEDGTEHAVDLGYTP